MFKFLLILIILFSSITSANTGSETGFEIPRYVSIKSNDANIRVGPSMNYPIKIKYIKKDYPLRIIEEYEDWRKVVDHQKNIGWIHRSLISGYRTGIITSNGNEKINILNTVDGLTIGKIGNKNIVFINKCKIEWCLISIDKYSGWVNKKNLWGVKEKEIININFFQIFIDLYWKYFNLINNLKNNI